MSFQVSEITTFDEFLTIQKVMNEAYSNPHFPFWELLKGPTLEESSNRYWHIHTITPGSHWIKATNAAGEVVGGAHWVVNEKDPFESVVMIPRASWWPEGDKRDIANQLMHKFFAERPKRMARPHVLMSILFVAPEHRRRGVGNILMKWGIETADRLGLESFVEASPLGYEVYKTFGYVIVGKVELNAEKKNASPEWEALWKDIAPNGERCIVMWRPKGGVYVPGETKYSWE